LVSFERTRPSASFDTTVRLGRSALTRDITRQNLEMRKFILVITSFLVQLSTRGKGQNCRAQEGASNSTLLQTLGAITEELRSLAFFVSNFISRLLGVGTP
jgi:hypothetical protein